MTQTPALFEAMAQEVKADCDRVLAEARQEAERIQAEGRRVADQEYAQAIEATRREIELADRRERQRLDAEHTKAFQAVQHRVVEEVLGRAREEMARMARGDEFGAILEALLGEILQESSEGRLDVLTPPAHADRIRRRLVESGRGHLEAIPYAGLTDGVAVQDKRRTFRVSNTLSGRLAVMQDEARKRAQARLFEKEA